MEQWLKQEEWNYLEKQQGVRGVGRICWQHIRDLNEDITQYHVELPLNFIILKADKF